MGKVSLILVMLFIGVIGVITLSVYNSSSQVAEVMAKEETAGNVGNLGAYALKYAIKEVKSGNVTESTTQNFDDFEVLNGEINSIIYSFSNAADSVKIKANVSWQGAAGMVQHQSEAWLHITSSPGGGGGSGSSAAPFELEDERTNLYTVPHRSAFWKFNENGGTIAQDSVSDNDGTLTDGWVWNGTDLPQWETGRTGKAGSALQFNGWDNYVHIPDADSLDLTEEGTISTWIYIEDYTNSAGFVHKGDYQNWRDEAYSLQTDESGEYVIFIINNDWGNDLWLNGNIRLQKNNWYHLIATFNTEKVALYIDGELDAETNNTIGEVRNTTGGLNIGAQIDEYTYDYGHFGLDGMIDQVSIFKEFLNEDKAKKLYLQELASSYLALNQTSGDVAYDGSGADNNADLTANLQQNWTTGSSGNGLQFSSDTDRLIMPSAPNLTDMDEISIAAWINIDEFTGSNADIVNKNSQYTLRLGSSGNSYKPAGIAYLNGRYREVAAPWQDRISVPNRWYHLTFTYDNQDLKIYIDADEKKSKKEKNKSIEGNNTIYISGSQSSNEFKGILDELMIFEKGLTDEEIAILNKRDVVKELKGRWPLNEGSGDIAYDTSKYSHDGTLQDAFSWDDESLPEWIEGKFSGALRFDGVDDFVGAEQGIVNSYPFSMGAWVRTSSMADENEDRVIFSLANNQENNSYWGVYLGKNNQGEGRAVIGARNGGLEADYSNDAANRIDDGSWHFVVGVFEAADNRKLYVDGQLQAAGSRSVEFDANVNSWAIGRWCDSTPSAYFKGDIDHVRIWNRALTTSEVIFLNTDPAYSTDLMGYWAMNEDSGTEVFDNSQYSNTGELENSDGNNSWVSGHSENALEMDGDNDYVLIPDDDSLDGVNKLSIEFWVNPDNLDGRPRGIISKRSSWGWQQAYSVFFWSNNRLYVDIDGTDNRFSYDAYFENDKWYYIVVTYDGEADWAERVKVYVDGELKKTAGENSTSIPNYNSNLYLGTLNQNYRYYLGGKLDEVKIHNRVLTPTEVQNNFSGGSDINLDNLVSYWNLNEGAGGVANDIQDGNNGEIIGGADWTEGILGTGLQLDGRNEYIQVDDSQNLQISDSITLEMWVNTSQKNRTTILAEKADSYGIGQERWNGWFSYLNTGNGYYFIYWGEGKPQHHQWYYLVLTYDGNNMNFYVDGQLKVSETFQSSILTYNNNFNVGYSNWFNNFFEGKVDEIRLWNTALSEADIQRLYNNGSPIVPEPGGGGETVFKIVYWSE